MSTTHSPTSLSELRKDRPTAKEAKLAEIGAACQQAIYAGIEIRGEHYALTLNDQTNISNLAVQAQAGEIVLYHADGKLCRPYKPEEILEIMTAAVKHKTFHTTLCNHLNVWIRRTEDAAELEGIHYDSPLPEDLAASMEALLGGKE